MIKLSIWVAQHIAPLPPSEQTHGRTDGRRLLSAAITWTFHFGSFTLYGVLFRQPPV